MANPFAPEQCDIYIVLDPPHLIKTFEATSASDLYKLHLEYTLNFILLQFSWGFHCDFSGKVIDWQHLVHLGTGADKAAPGLSLIPKLKYEHKYLTSYSKMRVDLVSQVSRLKLY